MFKSLFQSISSGRSNDDPVLIAYNNGVNALARGELIQAIAHFKPIAEQHPSAAYNLGLIYLGGNGQMTPKYHLARRYFQLAAQQGHPKAEMSAQVIGLNGEKKLSPQEYMKLFTHALAQYIQGRQWGNLAYLIAQDIKRNVLETSSSELYSLDRFLSYELYCIRNYANDEVEALYETSSLTELSVNYLDDWESGETAVISDYLNEKVFALIISLSQGNIRLDEMGPLRLAIVNTVYEFYLER